METALVIGLILSGVIYALYIDSKKQTTGERIVDAISRMLIGPITAITKFAQDQVEPTEKRKNRLAKEALARENGHIYRGIIYTMGDNPFKVDEDFVKSLKVLGLTKKEWRDKVAIKIYYIGQIKMRSRDPFDYSRRLDALSREYMVNSWKDEDMMITLKKALNYFNIPIDEWVKYGDAVIEMHDLHSDWYLRKYGDISKISPRENNLHLL
jgi:hypothetical protein